MGSTPHTVFTEMHIVAVRPFVALWAQEANYIPETKQNAKCGLPPHAGGPQSRRMACWASPCRGVDLTGRACARPESLVTSRLPRLKLGRLLCCQRIAPHLEAVENIRRAHWPVPVAATGPLDGNGCKSRSLQWLVVWPTKVQP